MLARRDEGVSSGVKGLIVDKMMCKGGGDPVGGDDKEWMERALDGARDEWRVLAYEMRARGGSSCADRVAS
jgi:hypothetical protein